MNENISEIIELFNKKLLMLNNKNKIEKNINKYRTNLSESNYNTNIELINIYSSNNKYLLEIDDSINEKLNNLSNDEINELISIIDNKIDNNIFILRNIDKEITKKDKAQLHTNYDIDRDTSIYKAHFDYRKSIIDETNYYNDIINKLSNIISKNDGAKRVKKNN